MDETVRQPTPRIPGHSPVPRYRSWRGLAVLSQGFRPFFLLAGLWAIVGLQLWIHAFAGLLDIPTSFDSLTWHSHEMLFDYAAAVLAGFLLTAIPNWTGRLPLQGRPLAGLALLWIVGRLAIGTAAYLPPVVTVVLDLSFLTALLLVVLREIWAGKNWRNAPLLAALAVLILANGLIHAGQNGWLDGADAIGSRLAPFGIFVKFAMVAIIVTMLGWTFAPHVFAVGIACLIAVLLHLFRLRRWQGPSHRARADGAGAASRIHLGVRGPGAARCHHPRPPSRPRECGASCIDGRCHRHHMTLAVMSRAIRGHTNRALTADIFTTLMFVVIILAALTRIAAPYAADHEMTALMVSSALWELAFLVFILLHARALLTNHRRG